MSNFEEMKFKVVNALLNNGQLFVLAQKLINGKHFGMPSLKFNVESPLKDVVMEARGLQFLPLLDWSEKNSYYAHTYVKPYIYPITTTKGVHLYDVMAPQHLVLKSKDIKELTGKDYIEFSGIPSAVVYTALLEAYSGKTPKDTCQKGRASCTLIETQEDIFDVYARFESQVHGNFNNSKGITLEQIKDKDGKVVDYKIKYEKDFDYKNKRDPKNIALRERVKKVLDEQELSRSVYNNEPFNTALFEKVMIENGWGSPETVKDNPRAGGILDI